MNSDIQMIDTQSNKMSEKSIMYSSMIEEMCLAEKETIPEIHQNEQMLEQRSVLLKQMEEIYIKYSMSHSTWFLAVNIMDRILRACNVASFNCVLFANTIIYIASKYSEKDSSFSSVDQLIEDCDHCDHGFNLAENMERLEMDMLNKLNFEITVPTPFSIADIYLKYNFINHEQYSKLENKQLFQQNVFQLLHRTSFSSTFLSMKPSIIAQACIHSTMMKANN